MHGEVGKIADQRQDILRNHSSAGADRIGRHGLAGATLRLIGAATPPLPKEAAN